MNCPNEGVLRAALDGELVKEEADRIHQHVRGCANCIALVGRTVGEREADPRPARRRCPERQGKRCRCASAYGRYRDQFGAPSTAGTWWGRGVFRRGRQPALGGVAAACTLALILSFAPARTLGPKSSPDVAGPKSGRRSG